MAVYNRARNPIPSRGTGVPASTFAAMRSQGWSPGRGQIPSMPAPMAPTAPMVAPGPMPARPAAPLVSSATPEAAQPGLLNPLANLGMTGPGFTQRNIEIPQPNTREAIMYGTPGHVQQFPRFAPEQEAAMRSLLGGGLQGLSQTDLSFAPIANLARKKFQEETIPSLAERFNILGGGGRSSAENLAYTRAGTDLESQLAALGSQYNLQKFGALTNLSRLGLEPAYETTYFPAQPGFAQQFAQGAAAGIPAATDLLGRAISSVFSGGAAPANEQQAAQQIASLIPQEAKQQIVSSGWETFKNAIWPTLIGAAGGALGAFPLGPAAIFAALLGGGLGLAAHFTK